MRRTKRYERKGGWGWFGNKKNKEIKEPGVERNALIERPIQADEAKEMNDNYEKYKNMDDETFCCYLFYGPQNGYNEDEKIMCNNYSKKSLTREFCSKKMLEIEGGGNKRKRKTFRRRHPRNKKLKPNQ
jgi:hypothetical protein